MCVFFSSFSLSLAIFRSTMGNAMLSQANTSKSTIAFRYVFRRHLSFMYGRATVFDFTIFVLSLSHLFSTQNRSYMLHKNICTKRALFTILSRSFAFQFDLVCRRRKKSNQRQFGSSCVAILIGPQNHWTTILPSMNISPYASQWWPGFERVNECEKKRTEKERKSFGLSVSHYFPHNLTMISWNFCTNMQIQTQTRTKM